MLLAMQALSSNNPAFTEKLIYIKTRPLLMHKLKKRGDNLSLQKLIIVLFVIILIMILFYFIMRAGNVLLQP